MSNKFSPAVKNTLRKAVGYHCSAPHCGKQTNVFNRNSNREQYDGDAAHIYGANPGSGRYDDLPHGWSRDEERNGIWLCAVCHRQVDQNQELFPGELLEGWKAWAEKAHESGYRGMNRQTHASADIREDLQRAKDFLSGDLAFISTSIVDCYRSVPTGSRFGTRCAFPESVIGRLGHLVSGWGNSHQHWTFVEDFQFWQNEIVRLAEILCDFPEFKRSSRNVQVDWYHTRDIDGSRYCKYVFEDPTAKAAFTFVNQIDRFYEFLQNYRGTSNFILPSPRRIFGSTQ
ncbi:MULTISPECIES: hypothetical protein [Pseudomonas]|uniref:hypothetical protein n=1 Tax=Pseudomonas TaxID=286 RepID=UPI0012DB7738|nr:MULTISPECIES: hypothetical protein [Pseudomonas]UII15374.1 hypothetical protein LRP86_02264 [Pseudomonas brassicacearum]